MIAAWMAYALVIAALAQRRGVDWRADRDPAPLPSRWIWVAALLSSLLLAGVVRVE